MFESKVTTVTGFTCEENPPSRNDPFADHVDRVLWSVGVLGLPCRWMPKEYGGSAHVVEAARQEAARQ